MTRVGYLTALGAAPAHGAARQLLSPRPNLGSAEPVLSSTPDLVAPAMRNLAAPPPQTVPRSAARDSSVPDAEAERAGDTTREASAPPEVTERLDPPPAPPQAPRSPAEPADGAATSADEQSPPTAPESLGSRPQPARMQPRRLPLEPAERTPIAALDGEPAPRLRIGTIDVTVVPPPPAPLPAVPRPQRSVAASQRASSQAVPLSRGAQPWFGLAQR
jgi:hypothetical protein